MVDLNEVKEKLNLNVKTINEGILKDEILNTEETLIIKLDIIKVVVY